MCVGSCELLMDENLQHQRTLLCFSFQFPVVGGGQKIRDMFMLVHLVHCALFDSFNHSELHFHRI
jgi:hypothetical protein